MKSTNTTRNSSKKSWRRSPGLRSEEVPGETQGREGWRDFKRPRGSGSWGQRACLSLCSKEKEGSSKKFCFTFLSPQIKRKTLHWGLLDSPFLSRLPWENGRGKRQAVVWGFHFSAPVLLQTLHTLPCTLCWDLQLISDWDYSYLQILSQSKGL